MTQTMPMEVAEVFAPYPASVREKVMDLRQVIFDTAISNPAISPLTETLKWGEPSYLTQASKSGSTVRIA
jgi:hypothetical protein